ncbi:hypothetical protein HJG60_011617 [Phyllostomus discolor]|uniref:Uncharacterized protein n=1 Tax=Phyllostomus discolor TaxID=89673 RepID=A0A833ZVM1_9CHIR|nr:hypothetical protein HJG60_011617 [Phyllostomus discolor]
MGVLSVTTAGVMFGRGETSYCDLIQDPPLEESVAQGCVCVCVCVRTHAPAHVHMSVNLLLSGCVTQGGLRTHQKNPLSLLKTGFFLCPLQRGREGGAGGLRGSQWITTKATLLPEGVGGDEVAPGTWHLASVFRLLSSGRPLRPGTRAWL